MTDLGDVRPCRPPEPEDPAAARPDCSLAEYVFSDEWDVAAPPEDVFDTLADGSTYPRWWKPVYLDVRTDGEYTHQHFKGRLPYHLHTRTRTTHSERPHTLAGRDRRRPARHRPVDAHPHRARHPRPLRLARHADRRLLRLLTPLLRPALRCNHDWAIARAIEGLEPYVRERAKVVA